MVDLGGLLDEAVQRHPVPGAGVGVLHAGKTTLAFAGVTSVDDPLPVDARTLFQIGSISKTYTACAVMRLVGEGRLALDDPVRQHVPELSLVDASVRQDVRVRHLLNHTAGWDGTMTSGEERPEQDLADFVTTTLPLLEQVGPLGARAEYNNAAVALAGRLVEEVVGQRYEEAIRTLLLDPLGMTDTHFTTDDLMTERVVVGHLAGDDDGYRVARPWRWPRAGNPEGGLVSTLGDQLRWAQFALGDGCAPDGTRILREDDLAVMRTPTVRLVGNAMGDAIGLGWFLRDVAGTTMFGHQGTTNGQFAELRCAPSRDFAVVAFANGGPAGTALLRELVDDTLDQYLGLRRPRGDQRAYDATRDGEVAGSYVNNLAHVEVTADGGVVRVQFVLQPEAAARMGDEAPVFEPAHIGFEDDDSGTYVVREGEFAGEPGAFVRDDSGEVVELVFGGRWYRRRRAP